MFGGLGVEASDQWLKNSSEAENLFKEQNFSDENQNYIDGLECRWEPVKSHRGQMVTGIIKVAKKPQTRGCRKNFPPS